MPRRFTRIPGSAHQAASRAHERFRDEEATTPEELQAIGELIDHLRRGRVDYWAGFRALLHEEPGTRYCPPIYDEHGIYK